jgi:signal peptidase I
MAMPAGEAEGGPAGEPRAWRPGARALAWVREVVVVVAVALGLSLLIKTFLVQAFSIPSGSMQDTLTLGDRVLVSRLTPGPGELRRGDVVVFDDPGRWLETPAPRRGAVGGAVHDALAFAGVLPPDAGDHLIKRVIGLPGDHVACCDAAGRLTVNGVAVREPYVRPGDEPSSLRFDVTVPPGRLWVMGDHRSLSRDSRYHQGESGGTIPVDGVVGRAFAVVWPLDRAAVLHRPTDTFAAVSPQDRP